MDKHSISVVVPVKNGAKTLRRCLHSLVSQTLKPVEIIVLDSQSADDSVLIAKEYGATVITIPSGTFNHGLTRNIGVQSARGLLVYLTVQDAWLAETTMLEKMSGHFYDESIKAVAGHQAIPHENDKNPLYWFNRVSEPVIQKRKVVSEDEFNVYPLETQVELTAWDNVVAMYRKQAMLELPFVITDYAEDRIWSKMALLKGWTIVYDPSIVVYHYHHQTYRYAYQVNYTHDYHLHEFLGFTPGFRPLLRPLLQATWHLARKRELSFSNRINWILHNYIRLIAVFTARVDFLIVLRLNGKKGILKRYKKVCQTIPQGFLKNE